MMQLGVVLVVAVPIVTSACVVESMRPPTEPHARDTCTLPASFQDDAVDLQVTPGDQALPSDARKRLLDHLLVRVGPQVATMLRIREVWHLGAVPKREVRQRDGEPLGVAYAVFVGLPVVDDMSTCGNSVDREYCAGIWLNDRGEPLTEIGLPEIAHHPAKANLLSRAEVEAVVAETGREIFASSLNYEPSLDILVWHLEATQTRTSGESTYMSYELNAHTGAIIGWHEMASYAQ